MDLKGKSVQFAANRLPQKVVESLVVIIATLGRREIVAETIASLLSRQTIPSCLIVVGVTENDLPKLAVEPNVPVHFLIAPAKGLPVQRNHGLRQLPTSAQFVAFLDDDMEIHDHYCAEVDQVFRSCPQVAGFSGCLVANGNTTRLAARQMLDQHQIPPNMPTFGYYPQRWPGFYGCTMNIRRQVLEVEQFDERLPLYALGEDCEMGFRLSRLGAVGGSARCPAVHLATRTGRISEVGVGYAQVINYLYFAHKGIGYPKWTTYWNHLVRLPMVNLFFKLFPSRDRKNAIDRSGRFYGNFLAICDLLRGRLDPMNLMKISDKTK